jgi:hypothetical protein
MAVWSVFALTWLSVGCSRADVDRGVRRVERSGQEVGNNVRRAAETAKAGAERARRKLPQATARVRNELVALGHEARVRWDEARDKLRHRHEQPHH